jgi:hypothetical protein
MQNYLLNTFEILLVVVMPLLSVYPVEHSSATTPGTSQADHSDGK